MREAEAELRDQIVYLFGMGVFHRGGFSQKELWFIEMHYVGTQRERGGKRIQYLLEEISVLFERTPTEIEKLRKRMFKKMASYARAPAAREHREPNATTGNGFFYFFDNPRPTP